MPTGLRYLKLDLHVHTPASHDFTDRSATAMDVVEAAVHRGLDGIAITDHNTGALISDVQEAASERGLVVFPGVELTCQGGKGGIHILALFDPAASEETINDLLSACGVRPEERGKSEALIQKVPGQVFSYIVDRGGLAVAAHANSAKGLLQDMRGRQRIETVLDENLAAAEATDFDNEHRRQQGRRVVDILDGRDPDLSRRLAVYQASDNPDSARGSGHSLDGIGSRFSLFKMDEPSIESLRQCFVHPASRIRIDFAPTRVARITELSVDGGGFLNGQTIHFNQGLNSIIGGKGVGKSLIVEMIRFALECPSSDPNLNSDHEDKLAACLDIGSTVSLSYELADGDAFEVSKVYRGRGVPAESHCRNTLTGEYFRGSIPTLLPVLPYSQTEIIKIAESKTAQLDLIDRMIGVDEYERREAALFNKLHENTEQLAAALDARDRLEQIDGEIETKRELVRQAEKRLRDEAVLAKNRADKKQGILQEFAKQLADRRQRIEEVIEEIGGTPGVAVPQELAEDEHLLAARAALTDADEHVRVALQDVIARLLEYESAMSDVSRAWAPALADVNKSYDAWLRQQDRDERGHEAARQEARHRIDELMRQRSSEDETAQQVPVLKKARQTLLEDLDELHRELHNARSLRYQALTEASGGRLRLSIHRAASVDTYVDIVKDHLAGGNTIPVPDRRSLAEAVPPRRLVELTESDSIEALAQESGLSPANARKALAKLGSLEREQLLRLEYEASPIDVPQIEYQRQDGKYASLERLSVGQKCSALLMVALADGEVPVIIDQPEDALDVVSIWEDVSQRLIANKDRRQFIVTTHNSSVAVASDSDQFIVVRSSASQAHVSCAGAIDSEPVKSAVLGHLEGGQEPYQLRRRKYEN